MRCALEIPRHYRLAQCLIEVESQETQPSGDKDIPIMTRLPSTTRFTLVSLSLLSLGLAACGGDDPAEPADAQARLRATVPAISAAAANGFTVLDQMPAMDWIDSSLATTNTSFSNLPITLPSLGGDDTVLALTQIMKAEGDESAEAEALIQLIFNENNYVGDGYYRLDAQALCENPDDGTIDSACVQEIDSAEIAFRAVLAGDGLDISLAVGPERAEPLTLRLRSNLLGLAIDLAEGKKAITHLALITGEDLELPDVMEGVFAFTMTVENEQRVVLDAAIEKAVRLEARTAEGPFAFSSAAKTPLLSLTLDGAAQEVQFALDIGRTQLTAPWSSLEAESLVTSGLYALDFAGASYTTTLRADDQSINITNIGLGDGTTTLKLDDHVLFAMDLNANAGRRYNMTVSPTADGNASFAIDPSFDLSLKYDARPLANAGDLVEDFLLDETYRISFTGNNPTFEVNAAAAGIEITSGTLTISSTAAAADVVVNAGECLVENFAPANGAHAVLGLLSVSDCQPLAQ